MQTSRTALSMNTPDQIQVSTSGGDETLTLLHNLTTMLTRMGQEQLNPSCRGAGLAYLLCAEDEGKEEEEEVNNNNPNAPLIKQLSSTPPLQVNLT